MKQTCWGNCRKCSLWYDV